LLKLNLASQETRWCFAAPIPASVQQELCFDARACASGPSTDLRHGPCLTPSGSARTHRSQQRAKSCNICKPRRVMIALDPPSATSRGQSSGQIASHCSVHDAILATDSNVSLRPSVTPLRRVPHRSRGSRLLRAASTVVQQAVISFPSMSKLDSSRDIASRIRRIPFPSANPVEVNKAALIGSRRR